MAPGYAAPGHLAVDAEETCCHLAVGFRFKSQWRPKRPTANRLYLFQLPLFCVNDAHFCGNVSVWERKSSVFTTSGLIGLI